MNREEIADEGSLQIVLGSGSTNSTKDSRQNQKDVNAQLGVVVVNESNKNEGCGSHN